MSRFTRIKTKIPDDLRLTIPITEDEWQEIKACTNRDGKVQILLESEAHDTLRIDVRFFTWDMR